MPLKRTTRRRGRAPHGSDSEEGDVEREAPTDSDDSNDSEDDSESDSDSEPVSRRLTPNTSHSPGADEEEKPAPFFAATPATWADMVDESATLPVISFGELDANAVRKVRMADPQPDSTDDEPEQEKEHHQPVASTSRHTPRSQSARQAYQHRLDSDPSFVPVVGEFWGHDDRLLDKDLRSLSGWWRGRWQGRGRARGGPAFPPRGRGRGGFGPSNNNSVPVADSPVDLAWTHDGYEELQRRREDTRSRPPIPRGGAPLRGSPSFRARGTLPGRVPGRIWYTMKPEHMWTKQHDTFLYFDPALKPRAGQPPGVRVRLPGGNATIVRAIPRPNRPARFVQKPATADTDYVVRLPRAGKGKATSPPQDDEAFTVKLHPQSAPVLFSPPTNPLQPDADGWVQPTPDAVALAAAVSPPPVPASALPAQAQIQQLTGAPPPFYPFAPPPGFSFPPGPAFGAPPPPGFTQPQQQQPPGFSTHTPPPPGFSTHTPPPGFGTPPPFNAPLPPGVALDGRGMPYELASGRPVVLQAPAPPVSVPVMYGPPYGHHHAHSMSMGHAHSMSMGGHGHQHAPSISIEPALFAFARPGRVEIRAPGAPSPQGSRSPQTNPTSPGPRPPISPSPLSPRKDAVAVPNAKLRTGAAAFVPSHAGSPSVSVSRDGAAYFANGNGYDQGGNGYEANGYDGANGAGYDGYGAYAPPGATYYYPYYPSAPPPAADGTVYYQ
ncbi:hypothetical protein DFH08DRAFT_928781 [Mycena albidolilacea]|uniref:Btz domain-containing protein n=1 Tax=Mycena albidolilacea TaxID=1033008 RepID=A0AAD7AVD7_9AGAR|nr:hypothetical protein DFH08DRAFT_928781 [Mycena albidolilacea]